MRQTPAGGPPSQRPSSIADGCADFPIPHPPLEVRTSNDIPCQCQLQNTSRAETPQTPSVKMGSDSLRRAKGLGPGTCSQGEHANAPRTNSSPQKYKCFIRLSKRLPFHLAPSPSAPSSSTGSEDGVQGKGQPSLSEVGQPAPGQCPQLASGSGHRSLGTRLPLVRKELRKSSSC